MRPLRLAYLPASLRPGGAERQMLLLAERLPRDRFVVDFVVLSGPGEYDDRATAAGSRLTFVGPTPSPTASMPARFARRAGKVARYAQAVRRGRYDIVDAWLYPADVLAALMRPLTRTPVLVSGRRNIDPQHQFGPLERPIAQLSARLTDAVVANSAAVARYAIDHDRVDPAKVRIIRNGVEPIPPLPPAERAVIRSGMGVAEDEILIGCVANYLPVKQHQRLIEAFGILVVEGLPLKLALIGEGPMRGPIERQVRSLGLERSIRLHGSVPDPKTLYPAFDIVVQASEREGLPNSLLEAASAGCPIVATNAGGVSEVVLDGKTGLLVPVNDPSSLARALRQVILDADLRDRFGIAAREYSTLVFGIDRFVAEFAQLYEDLAARKGVRH